MPVHNLTWFDALNYTAKELKNSEQPKLGQMLGIGDVDRNRPKNTQVLMQWEILQLDHFIAAVKDFKEKHAERTTTPLTLCHSRA